MSDIHASHEGTRLTITRSFAAPRQFVWDAWTQREQIEKWWGPVGFTTTVTTMDVRPGGTWHYRMDSDQWGSGWSVVTYREIDPIDRLVYTDAFSDESGAINESMPQATNTVEFTESGGRTLVTIHADYPTEEDVRKVLEMGVEAGIESQFTRLDDLAAARTA